MTCLDFTTKIYELMHWDSKCRYKILGYKIEFENGYINVAMLTGDKKPVEIEQAGQQLTLDDNSGPANSTGEVYPDVEEEVSDGEPIMGEC